MVAGRTILEHCLTRLKAADVGPVILATTDSEEDDERLANIEELLTAAREFDEEWEADVAEADDADTRRASAQAVEQI